MELRRYLSIIRRRLLLIPLIVAAALVAGWLITPRTNTYTASTTLYVGSAAIDRAEVSGDRIVGYDRVIKTFTAMLPSGRVVSEGIANAGADRSPGGVSAQTQAVQIENTNLIRLLVTDRNPDVATALADGISDAFVDQIEAVEPTADQASRVISVYERAQTPGPDPSNMLRNLALAVLLGLVAAGGVVALLEHLDLSFRSIDDVERRLELPVLGVIPALGNHMPVTPAAPMQAPPTAGPPRKRGAPVA